MESSLEKLFIARQLILEVEESLIKEKKTCPYEIGIILKRLDDLIDQLKAGLS